MELSFFLNDLDTINRSLQRHVVDNSIPPPDFSVPLSDPMRARDIQGVEISTRFLDLFDIQGVNVAKPYRIEERDGETLFIGGKLMRFWLMCSMVCSALLVSNLHAAEDLPTGKYLFYRWHRSGKYIPD